MALFPRSARKKKTRNKFPGSPFPNYAFGDGDTPVLCKCVYDGTNFYVDSQTDIQTLYRNGSFGRSTLTLRNPLDDLNRNYEHRPYFKKAALNAKTIITSNFRVPKNGVDSSVPMTDECNSNHTGGLLNGNKEIESIETSIEGGGTSGRDTNKQTETKIYSMDTGDTLQFSKGEFVERSSLPLENDEDDRLELFPEEVIFLSFAVGCLTIETTLGKLISYDSLWKKLVEKNPDFPMLYAVYHYFRCKNWVPKPGQSYGGDYVLYELGPEFYHSLYIVHILGLSRPKPVWLEICARQRCASHASKFALFCEVVAPSDFAPTSPMSIFDFKIRDVPVYRWAPNLTL